MRATEIYDALVRESSPALSQDVADAYMRGRARSAHRLGQWSKEFGESAEGLKALKQAIADYEELVRRSPRDIDLWIELADCHGVYSFYCQVYDDFGLEKGRPHIERAKAIAERLVRANPNVTTIRAIWAEWLSSGANHVAASATLEEKNAKLRELEFAVTISRELVASDPDIPLHLRDLANSLIECSDLLSGLGRTDEAIALAREAEDVLGKSPLARTSQTLRRDQVYPLRSLAITLSLSGRVREAIVALRQVIARDDAFGGSQESRNHRQHLCECHLLLSYLEFGAGMRTEALESVGRAWSLLRLLTDPSPAETWDLAALSALWFIQGRPAAEGHTAEGPGRPEHAARAIALLRQAGDRGRGNPDLTAAFFTPALGQFPEFRDLMTDLWFPADPFVFLPEAEVTGPLPPIAADRP